MISDETKLRTALVVYVAASIVAALSLGYAIIMFGVGLATYSNLVLNGNHLVAQPSNIAKLVIAAIFVSVLCIVAAEGIDDTMGGR